MLCSLSGKARININHCRKVHAGILKRLGLRKIRLHDLRRHIRDIPSANVIDSILPTSSALTAAKEHLFARHQRNALGSDLVFEAQSSRPDELGYSHIRYQQYFRGLRVFGGETIVHVNGNGQLSGITNERRNPLNVNIVSNLAEDQVRNIVTQRLQADGAVNISIVSSELIIFDYREDPLLAYQVTAMLGNGLKVDHIVDASTGEILLQWDGIWSSHCPDAPATTCDGTGKCSGKANTQRYGCVPINTKKVSGIFRIEDGIRFSNQIRDVNESQAPAPGVVYTDNCSSCGNDNQWGVLNHIFDKTTQNTVDPVGQTDAADAAFCLQVAWDYFSQKHTYKGLNRGSGTTSVRVHATRSSGGGGLPGDKERYHHTNFIAMWQVDEKAIYVADNMVALDGIGHEYAHGVHLALTALTLNTGETGALAEATADIFGTLTEWHADNPHGKDPGDWLIGEKLAPLHLEGKTVNAIRDMQKPSSLGLGGFDFYDTGLSAAANCNEPCIQVHEAAGPAEHFFYYLLYGVPTTGSNASP